jgi:hypothetical protein
MADKYSGIVHPDPRKRSDAEIIARLGPIGRVVIELIDHQDQRYETAGDWYRSPRSVMNDLYDKMRENECTLVVRASRLRDDRGNFFALAVAYHELGEALACIANGVTEKEVDEFDVDFVGKGEPGDDPRSPYTRFHGYATACERILIGAMDLSWGVYERAINALPVWRKRKKHPASIASRKKGRNHAKA